MEVICIDDNWKIVFGQLSEDIKLPQVNEIYTVVGEETHFNIKFYQLESYPRYIIFQADHFIPIDTNKNIEEEINSILKQEEIYV